MPQHVEGVAVSEKVHAESGAELLARVTGEQDGIEKALAALLAISVRYARRSLVDQNAADGQLPVEIERLADDLRARVEKLRAEKAKLTAQRKAL